MPDTMDDYITVNITVDQAEALGAILLLAGTLGLFNGLTRRQRVSLESFADTMRLEITNQKGV